MAWFDGGIPQAINASRADSKLFLVYINGKDDDSKEMNTLWEEEGVSAVCKEKCVCIKLENESTEFTQFAELYPVVIVPVTFLIGGDGIPVEIIAGSVSAREIKEKINAAFEKSCKKTTLNTQTQATTKPAATNGGFSDEDEPLTQSSSSQESPSTSSSGGTTDVDRKKQAEMLQEKINERRLQKAKEFEEGERKREIERRQIGKAVQDMRDQQKDIKMKKELEERRKDKLKEKEALQKVRDEIARDRAERNAKFHKEKQTKNAEEQKRNEEQEALKKQKSEEQEKEREKIARIQFRLPHGSAFTRHYPRETLLGEMIADLRNQPIELPRDFRLALRMPRRVFQPEEYGSNLAELNLTPSASLAVQPMPSAVQVKNAEKGMLQSTIDFLLVLLLLPVNILTGLWKMIFGSGQTEQTSPAPTQGTPSGGQTPSPSAGRYSDNTTRRRNVPGASRETKQQGNMHRLSDVKRNDDEDPATWNGNSTQQM
uniref:UBX domain-containing protein 4 n=1 Tax=Phallusia mammillata TaxID=59560 RepID=A0A6F9DWU9_9ASCI|nr:UBX domain-containing protein 4-like [Phallusia mammillata]